MKANLFGERGEFDAVHEIVELLSPNNCTLLTFITITLKETFVTFTTKIMITMIITTMIAMMLMHQNLGAEAVRIGKTEQPKQIISNSNQHSDGCDDDYW